MWRGVVLFVLCGCGPAPAPLVADVRSVRGATVTNIDSATVRFVYQPYREGESFVMSSSSRIESKYRFEGPDGVVERDSLSRNASSKRVYVDSMKDGRIERANVHFEKWEHSLSMEGNELDVGPKLAGKSFMVLISATGGPDIRNLDGEYVAETDDVVGGVGELGAPALYDTVEVRVGDSAPPIAEGIGKRVAATLDARLHRPSAMSATFRRLDGDIGYFDVKVTVGPELPDEDLNYRMELAGELQISKKSGRLVHWELKGPLVYRGGGFAVLTGDER